MNLSAEKKSVLYKWLWIAFLAFLIAVGVSILTETLRVESNRPENTISFSGHGEVYGNPDIATVNFTIRKEAKNVKDAQAGVSLVEKNVLAFLKESKVEDKDIKTVNVSFNPKYEYQYEKTVCAQYPCPPVPGKSVIVGYEAYETVNVKVRNTDDAGKIVEGLGKLGVSELNGPNFAIDKEDALKDEARKQAIDNAKEKAETLAEELGIHLGKITSFNENGNYPMPMYDRAMMGAVSYKAESSAPALPKGENLITSDVTITYEIK